MWSIVELWFVVGDSICCFIFWTAKKFFRSVYAVVCVFVLIFRSPMQIVGVGFFVECSKSACCRASRREGIGVWGGL